MAADVYSENIMGFISPRLSFSNDLENDKTINNNQIDDNNLHSIADSTFDFAFIVDKTTSFHSSTADELFCNGNIIPVSLKKDEDEEEEEIRSEPIKIVPTLKSCLDQSSLKSTPEEKKKSLKEFLEDSIEEDEDEPNTINAKSFWKFRRSSSLNCDRNRRKGLVDSWKILPRSGSTGKFLEKIVEEDEDIRKSFWKFNRNNSINSEPAANVNCKVMNGSSKILRRSDLTNDKCRNFDYITKVKPFRRSSSLNSETLKVVNQGLVGSSDKFLPRSYSSRSAPKKHEQFMAISGNASEKKQVKSNVKGYGYGNVKVSSVLNLPSPYISRVSVDLFGFCMFCNGIGKVKKNRK